MVVPFTTHIFNRKTDLTHVLCSLHICVGLFFYFFTGKAVHSVVTGLICLPGKRLGNKEKRYYNGYKEKYDKCN